MGESLKPSDFFLSSRQVFGLLVPGSVWTVATALLIIDKPLKSLLLYAGEAKLIGALAFLATAHIVGTLLQFLSMKAAEVMSGVLPPIVPHGTEALRQQVRQTIRENYGKAWPVLYGVQPAEKDQTEHASQHELFAICKRSVLTRSPELGRRLLEHEDELNLIGLLALPYTVLCIALFVRAGEFSTIFLYGSALGWRMAIPFVCVLGLWYLIRTFQISRAEEYRSAYITFLLLERGIAGPRTDPDPGEIGEVISTREN